MSSEAMERVCVCACVHAVGCTVTCLGVLPLVPVCDRSRCWSAGRGAQNTTPIKQNSFPLWTVTLQAGSALYPALVLFFHHKSSADGRKKKANVNPPKLGQKKFYLCYTRISKRWILSSFLSTRSCHRLLADIIWLFYAQLLRMMGKLNS